MLRLTNMSGFLSGDCAFFWPRYRKVNDGVPSDLDSVGFRGYIYPIFSKSYWTWHLFMDQDLLQFGLKSFVTLFVVVDPLGVAPSFVGMTSAFGASEKRQTLHRALLIAFGVTLFFLFGGRLLLSLLGVTVYAFAISGGILLFIASLPMLFGQRPGLQAPERNEQGAIGEDIAIFPLAIPLLSGPGTITTVLLLTNQAALDLSRTAILVAITAVVYLIAWCVLYAGERIMARLGEGKVRIMTRVLGIVLAALAVQYVLNGVADYYGSLVNRSPQSAAFSHLC
jgi:multiple antibiotic resistance protein